MKTGDIMIHKLSGTLATIEETYYGYTLNFSVVVGGRQAKSSTKGYTKEQILQDWRYANEDLIKNIT